MKRRPKKPDVYPQIAKARSGFELPPLGLRGFCDFREHWRCWKLLLVDAEEAVCFFIYN